MNLLAATSQPGTKDRVHYFDEVRNGVMELSDMGIIVRDLWPDIPIDFPNALAGEMVVMPNQIHGIISIEDHWSDEKATSSFLFPAHTLFLRFHLFPATSASPIN